MELLTIQNLSVSFQTDEGTVQAVDDVSFGVREGEILGLVGESGCGKSVTATSILRLIPRPPGSIDRGRAFFHGQDLLAMPIEELRGVRGKCISFIFQEPMTALSPLQRMGHQLVETQRFHQSISRHDAWEKGEKWLNKVGIPDPHECMYRYPFELSGGMRQRAMIASAMILRPELIIADEPTTALDVTIQAQILDLLLDMKETNTSVLLITHDMGVIWEMCDRVAVMYAGKIVEIGPCKNIFEAPLHPYTEALLESIPSLGKGERLKTIEGQVPSPLDYPKGCRFHDRCPYAFERCVRECPALEIRNEHGAACFRADNTSQQELD